MNKNGSNRFLRALDRYRCVVSHHVPASILSKWGHHRGTHVLCSFVDFTNARTFVEVGSQTRLQAFVLSQEFPSLDVWAIDITPASIELPSKRTFRDIVGKSVEVARDFRDETLCVVYVDASHEYDDVCDDLRVWWPKVRRGGILAGHDYGQPSHPGVKLAVDGFISQTGVELNLTEYYNWWVIK